MRTHDTCGAQHGVIGQSVNGVDPEGVSLPARNEWARERQVVGIGASKDSTDKGVSFDQRQP